MSKLSENMRKTRKIYRRCKQSQTPQTGVYEWLCDNYYLYESEARWTREEMRRIKPSHLCEKGKRLHEICSEIVEKKRSISDGAVTEKLKNSTLSTCEIDAFPVFYRKRLLREIFESIKGGDCERNREKISYATVELRALRNLDAHKLSEEISPLTPGLTAEPGGVYPRMTAGTRAEYRSRIAELARQEHVGETEYLERCLCLAKKENKHIGEYLGFDSDNLIRGKLFVFLKLLVTAVLCLCVFLISGSAALATVAFLPLWAFVYKAVNILERKSVRAAPVLRMKKDDKSVKEAKVIIVIPTLIPHRNEFPSFKEHLKGICSSYEHDEKADENISICILADFNSAKQEALCEDDDKLSDFGEFIEDLNNEYGNHFTGLVRKRSYSKTQGEFTGRERKRGAIEDFTRFIYEGCADFVGVYGTVKNLEDTEFFMILDSDTDLPFDSLTELIACAVHPVNRKRYGVFSPVVRTKQSVCGTTRFTKYFSGNGGVSSYSGTLKELYQDYTGNSVFCGKGLVNSRLLHEKLTGVFKEETVLSHDIPEGEILVTKFVSDTEIAEGFPKTEISYFKRLDRWIRGDIQNIALVFDRTEKDGQSTVRLSPVSRYKLLENIRRAVTPVLQLVTLFTGSIVYGLNPTSFFRTSVLSCVIVILSLDGPYEIFLLGQRAFVCLRAAIKALVRRFITHKNMLSWTTAAGSEALSDKTLRKNILFLFPGTLAGIILLLLPGMAKLFGAFFVMNIFFSRFTAQPASGHENIGFSDEKKLYEYARDTWHYYESFVGKTDNYLPPDNMQETPVYRVAHRTSPTNTGLYMLCVLAACDFGFISRDELCERLESTVDTVERLKKYRGNLYNWYDTKTLAVLKPEYISTVDSGNFLCMLTALKEGLREYGQGGESHLSLRLEGLRLRIEKIIEETELGFLYDREAQLFHIGYSVSDGTFSKSYYDLLMSEARMTGYYAVAKRIVPKKHMESLSRIMSRSGRHVGPLSWTGTMFEFFLPHLLLPVYEGSMSEHALRYCEYCQKKRADGMGIPFGMSESGFYSFDRELNYQYKAHGAQKLALKPGLDRDLVVSSYSSFLLLPLDPKSAFSNLEKLSGMGMEGKYGFYEAVDFTQNRTGEQDYMAVRSYMAHHVGMSLISLSNAAFNGVMQKRFMSDFSMAGAAHFLMEEFPRRVSVFRDVELVPEQKKPERIKGDVKRIEDGGSFANSGRVFTNGEWTQTVFSNGITRSFYRGLDMTVPPESSFDEYAGVRIFAGDVGTKKPLPLTPSKVIYRDTCVTFVARYKGIVFTHTTGTHPRLCGETHVLRVKNMTGHHKRVKLYVWVNPFLSDKKSGMSHPAFTKLFMTDRVYTEEKCAVVTKNDTQGGEISLCGGLLHDDDVRVLTSNTEFFRGRPFGNAGFKAFDEIKSDESSGNGVPDPCMAFEISIDLSPGKSEKSVFFLGAGSDEKESVYALSCARADFENSDGEVYFSPCLFLKEPAKKLLCEELLVPVLCHAEFSPEQEEYIKCNTCDKKALWKFGVSGDNPIVLLELNGSADLERAGTYVSIVSALKRHGINVDLVMCFDEGGSYEAPIRHGVMSIIRSSDSIVFGNLFSVDLAVCTKEESMALKACASVIVGNEMRKKYGVLQRFVPATGIRAKREAELETRGGDFIPDGFAVKGKTKLPWSHLLCNRSFGTLVETGSLGFTWAFNSRENKLTKHNGFSWQRDDGERLVVVMNGKYYDLISGAAVTFYNGYAEYLAKVGQCMFRVTVFVPKKGMTKRIRVEMKNTGERIENFKIGYLSEPALGETRENSGRMTCEVYKNGLLICADGISPVSGYAFFGIADNTVDFYSTDLRSVLSGQIDTMSPMPFAENCVFVGKKISLTEDEVFVLTFSLSFGKSEKAALFFGTDYSAEIPHYESALKVSTGEKALDVMINTWLPLQIINSRIFGRTGFYQCGGAFGFRDQLQDAMNISLIEPSLFREIILRCSCVQFAQGDVLHWWHSFEKGDGGIRGIRTRCSDDMLWFPLALSHYTRESGDTKFLRLETFFLSGEELHPGETERYAHFERSTEKASLYEHGKRALLRGINLGENGLVKMGSCDWNDGYSRVGINGDGTSVWGSMFCALVADSFASVARTVGDEEFAKDLTKKADELRESVDRVAYRDGYYLRAFFDDGTSMNGIDSLPQSFAAFCHMPYKERRMSALSCAIDKLYDAKHGVIRLFWPPLTPRDKTAGYVNFYAPGTRENGGQYTHAAVWLAGALLKEGFCDEAYRMLCDINPVNKYFSEEVAERYLGEPFALAGDVYAAGSYSGRAGWTQYTGSAAWLWRTVVTDMLGIHEKSGVLSVTPRLPAAIPSYTATYDDGKNIHKIKVTQP